MFSCWPLFNTEAVFSFFDLLVEVSVVFTAVCSIVVSCKCFSFFISSCSSFTFRLCLSLFLMFEIHNFLEGIFHCVLYRLLGLVNKVFPVCLGCCCGRFCWFYLFLLLVKCQLVISRHSCFIQVFIFVDYICRFNSRFRFVFKVLVVFRELTLMQNFLFAVSFDVIVFLDFYTQASF